MKSLTTALLIGTAFAAAWATGRKQTSQPFSIEISAPTAPVKAGSDVYLKVRLINTSNREVVLGDEVTQWMGADPRYGYQCHDSGGKAVNRSYPVVGSLGDHPVATLKPGEKYEHSVRVSSACDLTRPGKYRIQLSRSDPSDSKRVIVRSNEITVTVKP